MTFSICLAIAGCLFAILPLCVLYIFLFCTYDKAKSKSKIANQINAESEDFKFLEKLFVDLCVLETKKSVDKTDFSKFSIFKTKKFNRIFLHSGIHKKINSVGFSIARIKFTLGFVAFGCLTGFVISVETSFLLAVISGIYGFRFCMNVFSKRAESRDQDMQSNLHEMLDILLIGVRAGLSFDRGLKLYTENFNCTLSRELRSAQSLWEKSLKTREEALRGVAETYDSIIFLRLVESISRSLNLGTSLEECLQSCAVEAKSMYKAERETKIQKAPVKMMIPTATLILPAMLILVLGPVLLEFINGSI